MTYQSPQFHRLESPVVPLLIDDVDTDQIIPAEHLKTTERDGLGQALFSGWREDPDFVLHDPAHRDAQILLAGENFGCGSSREHAVWALVDYGFRVVLSTRFADIFRNNALKNGLLPIELDPATHRSLQRQLERDPSGRVKVDLEALRLRLPSGEEEAFSVDPFARRCLLEGIDALGYLLSRGDAITTHEARYPSRIDTHSHVSLDPTP